MHTYDERTHILEARSMPDTPESTRSDLAQLAAGGIDDDEELGCQSKNKANGSTTTPSGDGISLPSFNFVSSIVSTGILAMPFALKEAGFGLGILLVLVLTLLTDYSLVFLVRAGQLVNANTYQDVVRAAFGRPGFVLLTVLQFLYPFIAMIGYNVIIGDVLSKLALTISGPVAKHTIIASRHFLIGAVSLLVTLPMSLYRNVGRLVQISLLSTLFVLFLVATMIYGAFTTRVMPTKDAWQFANVGVSQALSIMAYAFTTQQKAFLISGCPMVDNERPGHATVISHIGVLFSTTCSLIIAMTGYATFTGYTHGNILENYCSSDDLMTVSGLLFMAAITVAFGIDCYVIRLVIENAIFPFREPPSLMRHITTTVVIVVLTVVVSMVADCLALIVQLNGIISAAPLGFILPALCLLQLQQERILRWRNLPCILTALFGVAVSAVGLAAIVYDVTTSVLPDSSADASVGQGHPLPGCSIGGTNSGWGQPADAGVAAAFDDSGDMPYCNGGIPVTANAVSMANAGALIRNNVSALASAVRGSKTSHRWM